jgi:Astacin (Peptidase family M12A)/Ricin-type beta-trefoil lectin domain-like
MAKEEFRSSPDVRTGLIKGSTFGYRLVRYSVINGEAIFEGDIVLGSVDEMERLVAEIIKEKDTKARAVIIPGAQFRWPGGVVPFTIDPELPDTGRVSDAIDHWHSRTGIRLVARTNEQNFVTFRPGDGCSSHIGMRGTGQQFITLAPGCNKGSTIHEIGHAVGLWHEQSREDRDRFIRILFENIEEGQEHNFDEHISDGDDIGRYDFGSIMHYDEFAFSKNDQPTIETLNGEDIGQRSGLSDADVQAVNFMYPLSIPLTLKPGLYTIQQKSNGRFVDAHEYSGKDFGVVTRPAQNNRTQQWILIPVGGVFKIQQKSNGRFIDAHEYSGKDFRLVTRTAQNNDTQKWVLTRFGGPYMGGLYTIQQKSNDRFVDAYQSSGKDFALVTRTAKNNDSQRWIVTPLGDNTFTVQQKSSGRFMDAHEIEEKDFALVTRPAQNNDTQRWTLTPVGVVCTIQQQSSGRFVDAYESSGDDFALVTRTAKNNDAQRWIVRPSGRNTFAIQQKSSGRFMDAHEIEEKDFALVTRPAQNNDTQRWLIRSVAFHFPVWPASWNQIIFGRREEPGSER